MKLNTGFVLLISAYMKNFLCFSQEVQGRLNFVIKNVLKITTFMLQVQLNKQRWNIKAEAFQSYKNKEEFQQNLDFIHSNMRISSNQHQKQEFLLKFYIFCSQPSSFLCYNTPRISQYFLIFNFDCECIEKLEKEEIIIYFVLQQTGSIDQLKKQATTSYGKKHKQSLDMKFQTIQSDTYNNRMFQIASYQMFPDIQNSFCHLGNPGGFFQSYFYYVQPPFQQMKHINCIKDNIFFPQHIENYQLEAFFDRNHQSTASNRSHSKKQNKEIFILNEQRENIECKQQSNRQKFGRNIVSNIFHLMIKFTKHEKKLRKMIEKLIQRHGMIIRINQFYQILKKKYERLSPYATVEQMREYWTGKSLNQTLPQERQRKQEQCSKICRIIGKFYLENYHIPYAFNSKKIKSESRKLHMNAIRKICNMR